MAAAADAAAAEGDAATLHRTAFILPHELGHFFPSLGIVEQMLVDDPAAAVDLVITAAFVGKCNNLIAAVRQTFGANRIGCVGFEEPVDVLADCVNTAFFQDFVTKPAIETLAIVNEKQVEWHAVVAPGILDVLRAKKYTLVVSDFALNAVATQVAPLIGAPLVLVWPLVLQFPGVNTHPRIPTLISAQSLDMSWIVGLANSVFARVSLVKMSYDHVKNYGPMRTAVGLPTEPAVAHYRNYPVITPSIFGLDMAQPLYPNVVPVGLLQPAFGGEHGLIPSDFLDWFEACPGKKVVYVNMGSIGRLPASWIQMFERALVNVSEQRCVLWKAHTDEQQHVAAFGKSDSSSSSSSSSLLKDRQRLTHWLPFSPTAMLAKQYVSVFVTHCGDTSVYETVRFGAAFVGFALFADQPDMCARVADAKLGVVVDKMSATSTLLASAVAEAVAMEPAAREKMALLRMASQLQGGAARAAQVLRLAREGHGHLLADPVSSWIEASDADVVVAFAATIYVLQWLVWALVSKCCCGGASAKRRKQKGKVE